MVPVLIEAMKEQQNQISQLKSENKHLNAQLEDYNNLLKKLNLDQLIKEFGKEEYSVRK